jgi:hypothetical protein
MAKDKTFDDPNPDKGKDDKGHQGDRGNHSENRPIQPAPSSAASS